MIGFMGLSTQVSGIMFPFVACCITDIVIIILADSLNISENPCIICLLFLYIVNQWFGSFV